MKVKEAITLMRNDYDDTVQKRFTQIKILAFLVFGTFIIMFGLSATADFSVKEGPPNIGLALLLAFIIIFLCGIFCSRLHKAKWIKSILIGRGAAVLNEKRIKIASFFYMLFFLCSFASWFNVGVLGLIGSIFLGGKFWLVIFGTLASVMMIITWPKKDDLVDFIKN